MILETGKPSNVVWIEQTTRGERKANCGSSNGVEDHRRRVVENTRILTAIVVMKYGVNHVSTNKLLWEKVS